MSTAKIISLVLSSIAIILSFIVLRMCVPIIHFGRTEKRKDKEEDNE